MEKILMLGKIEKKRRRGQQKMRGLDSVTNTVEINLSKFWEIVEDRVCCNLWVTKSRTLINY